MDETVIGADLNGDGALGWVTELNRPANYVGGTAETPVVTVLYPDRPEFLHTAWYVGVTDEGDIIYIPRLKEVRLCESIASTAS